MLARVTYGDVSILAELFLLWDVAATGGNLLFGRLVDRFESRTLTNAMLWLAVINICALPWISAYIYRAAIALVIWGVCRWGFSFRNSIASCRSRRVSRPWCSH
ncbi:hypothetical protein [Caballeronia sp. INDeC2]|uniref:hypothetical protein n=1 Tax=Caballeronia sp. INDeC2 TaxID=2921747 RepID=UPI0020293FBC|nr:hypothetical protein [Caballeronia sp. INDeC2]